MMARKESVTVVKLSALLTSDRRARARVRALKTTATNAQAAAGTKWSSLVIVMNPLTELY